MNISLLSAIARGFWHMDVNSSKGFMPFLNAIKNKGVDVTLPSIAENKLQNHFKSISASDGLLESSESHVNQGSILMVSMSGVLMKYQNCGVLGTAEIIDNLKYADSDERFIAHVISMDTPGGTVNGLKELADTVKGLTKPVYGYVNGMACSAGYYSLCYADEIFLSSTDACVGSIGTMMSFRNWNNSKEVLGFEDVVLNSSLSPDKNKAYMDAKDGDYAAMLETLDQYAQSFIDVVKDARPKINPSALTGKTFLGANAIEMGLADGIASLDDVCNRILEKHGKQTA